MTINRNYFKVPNSIFTIETDKYEKLVLMYLFRCQNNNRFAFPSYETIARDCSISRRKAILTIKSLLYKEFITKNTGNWRCSNLYELVLEKFSSACDAPSSVCGAPGSAGQAPNKEPMIKNISNNNYNGHFSQEEMTAGDKINQLIEYYLQCYKEKTGCDHPRLKAEQIERISEELWGFIKEFDLCYDDTDFLQTMVDKHFNRKIRTDYNINHFATRGILENIHYEVNRL